jgi:hypothetical protein
VRLIFHSRFSIQNEQGRVKITSPHMAAPPRSGRAEHQHGVRHGHVDVAEVGAVQGSSFPSKIV